MSMLTWDGTGDRLYETGVDRGVYYAMNDSGKYGDAVAWNGLTGVTESPDGADANDIYADNIKYLNLMSAEEASLSIEAYTYPEEFEECDGSREIVTGATIGQQPRKMFGLSYRTLVGNDQKQQEFGYKLHLVYGCLASPSERSYATVNDSPEAITFSWEYTTSPVDCKYNGTEYKKVSCITLSERAICYTKTASGWTKDEAKAKKWEAFKHILFGEDPDATAQTEGINPHLPMPSDVVAFFQ